MMARKSTDTVQLGLRIREALRRRVEQAAAKRAVSINYEITSRLEQSFDRESLFTLDQVAQGFEKISARYDAGLLRLQLQGDLIRDAEALLAALPVEVIAGEAVAPAVTRLRTTITAIDNEWRKFGRSLHAT